MKTGCGGDGLSIHDGLETRRWNGTKSASADCTQDSPRSICAAAAVIH